MTVMSLTKRDVGTQASLGQWDSRLLNAALSHASDSHHVADWICYVDITQSIKGISWQEWQMVAKRYIELKMNSPALLLRLLNLLTNPELLIESDAAERCFWYEVLVKNFSNRFLKNLSDITHSGYLGTQIGHYPGLLAHSHQLIAKTSYFEKPTHLLTVKAKALLKSSFSFSAAMTHILATTGQEKTHSSCPRIAVVGNSPNLLASEHGSTIDSADIVVRFNNVSTLDRQNQHTGSRTDIWVMSPATSVKLCPPDAKLVIVSGLNALDRASFYWRQLPSLRRNLSQFPSTVWHDRVADFHAPPSAGTLLLASLASLEQRFEIQCFGFSANDAQRHSLANHHADTAPRSSRHNWTAEAKWLKAGIVQDEIFTMASE